MPEGAVYVGRPTKWGNPFPIGQFTIHESIGYFREYWLARKLRNDRDFLTPLRGKDLACWCGLCDVHIDGKPHDIVCPNCAACHADVLLEIANA